ncbi:unnamed protein product [Meganyctiphanes norvegica]|uniref:Cuticle protein n=1 Tax=Meganyctiphanes norvegica TaxID=48144 RepID=A0AAV2QDP5_MEGNR
MAAAKVFLVCVLVGAAMADRAPSYGPPPAPAYSPPPSYSPPSAPPAAAYRAPQDLAPAKYDFDWSVKDDASGNDFGQSESRDGDFTEGSYYVLLPDGRLQRVSYYVDGDSGFVAEVEYEETNQGRYQAPKPSYSAPQPSYQPPTPSYQPPTPSYQTPSSGYQAPRSG